MQKLIIKKVSIPVCKDPAVCKESAVCKELAVYEEKAICEDTKICTDTKRCKNTENCKVSVKTEKYNLIFKPAAMGEHKVVIRFTDNTEDFVVLNVMDKIWKIIWQNPSPIRAWKNTFIYTEIILREQQKKHLGKLRWKFYWKCAWNMPDNICSEQTMTSGKFQSW